MFDFVQALNYVVGVSVVLAVVAVYLVRRRRANEADQKKWNHTRHYGAVDRYIKNKKESSD